MANLPSTQFYIQTEATRFRSAVAESVAQQIGSAINWLNDQIPGILAAISALQNQVFTKFTDISATSTSSVTLGTVTTDGTQSVQCVGFSTTNNGATLGSSGLFARLVTGSPTALTIERNGTPIFTLPRFESGSPDKNLATLFHDVPPAGTWTYTLVCAAAMDSVQGRVALTRLKVGI